MKLPAVRQDRAPVISSRRSQSASPPKLLSCHHKHGVVPGNCADRAVEPGPVERRGHDMSRSWRRPEHYEVARGRDLHYPLSETRRR